MAAHGAAAPKRGGTLKFVVPAEPPSFDGHRETTFALIHPIAPFYMSPPSRAGFLFGYAAMEADEIREGIRRFGEVLSAFP